MVGLGGAFTNPEMGSRILWPHPDVPASEYSVTVEECFNAIGRRTNQK